MDTFNKYFKIARQCYTKELKINQYFENLKLIEDAQPEIKAELKSKTVKVLKSINAQLGNFADSRHKKDNLINKAYDSLISYFLIGRSVSYFLGEDTHDSAQNKLIQGTTAETLEKFYSERAEKQKAVNKACENPETLAEFRTFIDQRGKDQLTPEQLTKYEELTADITLDRQKREEERQNTVNKIQNENVEFALHETKHSKTGAEIFTVLMINRVEREEFKLLRSKAKKMGGYYSRFTNLRATPPIKAGFNFGTVEEARAFMGLKEEDHDTTERQEAREEEKQLTAGERMKERAEKIIEKAEVSLNQDRRTNTHRQASQAAHSEAKARKEIVFAKKLIKIAEGFDNGTIKYLHKLRNGKQLEQLESILNRGKYNRIHEMKLTHTERLNEEAESKPLEDVNFIVYPFPLFYVNTIKSIFLKYEETSGMKQGVKKILKSVNHLNEESDKIILKGSYQIDLFKKTASKISDQWDRDRILDTIKDFERIQKMGLTNEAILKTALRELIQLSEGTETSPEEKAKAELLEMERSFIKKKISGFFPTPKPLIDKMFSMAKVFDNDTILEPSAGLGHIADQIKNKYPQNDLSVIEFNYNLWEVLNKKGFEPEHENFLNTSHKYDVIFMNPPFEKHQDIDHIKHAFKLLNDGGRLVCIMAGNKHENSNNKKIIEFLAMVEEFGYIQQNEEGSFKSAFNSTNVNTITVYLEKPEAPRKKDHEEEQKKYTEGMHRDENGAFDIPGHLTVYNSAGQDVTKIYKQSTPDEAIQCASNNEQLTLF